MLKELFEKNPNIVINTDIDGVMSGIILCKYCGCKIVGFTNSKDSVWLVDEHDDLYANVYVDMFVTDDRAICVDQHIVALNADHQEKIKKTGNKYSPQIDRNMDLSDYKHKYPFGTFQYLVAQLEKEGVRIDLIDMNAAVPNSQIKVGDLLNRADDAMVSTLYAYRKNAESWWNWLLEISPDGNIKRMKDYLEELKINSDMIIDAIPLQRGKRKHSNKEYEAQREKDVRSIKDKTKKYFADNFDCTTTDGGFNRITSEDGNILPHIKKYIESIAGIFNFNDIEVPTHYNLHSGAYYRTCWLDFFPDFADNYDFLGKKIFSYAFIYGPNNDGQPNFSFTVDMK